MIVDLDYPIAFDNMDKMSISEKVNEIYKQYKERNDLASFWQFQFAIVNEMSYLISQNPDPFFRNLTEEQIATYNSRFMSCCAAVKELAKYDTEVAAAFKAFEENNKEFGNHEERVKTFSSLATAKQALVDLKDIIAARRAELLK